MSEQAPGSLLQVQELTVCYAGSTDMHPALDSVTFAVGRGEVVGLAGESGSGKTTLALALLKLLPPSARILSGAIRLNGHEILALGERAMEKIRGRMVSIIFQEPEMALNPVVKAVDQVAELIAVHRGWDARRCREEARRVLADVRFGDSERLVSAYPHQLSGGQRQRLAMALALACGPALLIADEPTASLDARLQAEWMALVKDLRARLGLAVLLISHDPSILAGVADRLIVLHRGRIAGEAEYGRLRHRPSIFSAAAPASPRAQAEEPLLAASDLRKTYRQRRWLSLSGGLAVPALRGVSLSIDRGRTMALVGESGSGKSTLGRCLAGLERPDAGEVRLNGRNLLGLGSREFRKTRRQIQILFQGSAATLNPRFSALEIVAEPLKIVGVASRREQCERALALMDGVGLPARWSGRKPAEFSGGQRQRLALARALALEPKLLILDEPLRGLDLPIQAQLIKLLRDLQAALALAYLFISHDLRLAAELGDDLAVMEAGRIVEYGPAAEVARSPRHPHTRALLEAMP